MRRARRKGDKVKVNVVRASPVFAQGGIFRRSELLDMEEMTASAAHQMCVGHAGRGDGHDRQERRPLELLGPVEDGRRDVAQELERVLPGRLDGREGAPAAGLDLLFGPRQYRLPPSTLGKRNRETLPLGQ